MTPDISIKNIKTALPRVEITMLGSLVILMPFLACDVDFSHVTNRYHDSGATLGRCPGRFLHAHLTLDLKEHYYGHNSLTILSLH